jgi:hypothetical protein
VVVQRWIAKWPEKKAVALADRVFLDRLSEQDNADLDRLRGQRARGLNVLALVSLAALPALLGAAAWEGDDKGIQRGLASAAIFFAASFALGSLGVFASWIEPLLKKKAWHKRFILGPEDAADYEEQARESFELDAVAENAHHAIPSTLVWRAADGLIWVFLVAGWLLFVVALVVGSASVLTSVK